MLSKYVIYKYIIFVLIMQCLLALNTTIFKMECDKQLRLIDYGQKS